MKTAVNKPGLKRFFRLIYLKLVRTNDTAQKVSLGFGLGVFLGIFPGSGPLAALFFSFLLRLNRGSALLGSLLTNTWLSFATFLLSIKVGAFVTGKDFSQTRQAVSAIIKDFHFKDLFNLSIFEIILPLLFGYLIIAFCLGIAAYLAALAIVNRIRSRRVSPGKASGMLNKH